MCPGCLSLIHRMSIYTGTEHEFIRLSVGRVYVCVFTVKALMVELCLKFCVITKVEGLSSNSFLILLKVYQHSCCCCSSPASYLHTGSIMPCHHILPGWYSTPCCLCFQAGPISAVWLESVFLMDFFY